MIQAGCPRPEEPSPFILIDMPTHYLDMPPPFADLPTTPEAHFQLCSYAAISHVLLNLARSLGSLDAALSEFPFLAGYQAELKARGLSWASITEAETWWETALRAWEADATQHLPLRAIRQATALASEALMVFIAIGLVEEDARFEMLFEALQGVGHTRPTSGLITAWWPPGQARAYLHQLHRAGLIQTANPEAPRNRQALQVPAPIWDAARGETHEQLTTWATYHSPAQLPAAAELILPSAIEAQCGAIPALLTSGGADAIIVRGPQHNGRHTLLGALARELNRGVIEVTDARQLEADDRRLLGPLATLLHALPVLAYDLAPGESLPLPDIIGSDAPLGIVLSPTGGLTGRALERAVTLNVEMPDQATRRRHWSRAARAYPGHDLSLIAEQYRLTSGTIYRAAPLAHAHAALNGRAAVAVEDIHHACHLLHRQALEVLTTRLEAFGDWSHLAVNEETRSDLLELAARCRQREQLPSAVGEAFGATVNAGVRALFTGPSGTGKTLAARVLAAQLQREVYRLDLAAVVNKYIGETEKNLNQVFARAEELDVILLIDEGDALLTQRTGVSSANDRYANLETNYLLQRLEAFTGIVLITTNAGERIDRAFQRRMDVIINFRPPEVPERGWIWRLHLPQPHAVDENVLDEISLRCDLTGGQIRNAALRATLLAINNGGVVTNAYLEEAVKREYRQAGAVCPLRPLPVRKVV